MYIVKTKYSLENNIEPLALLQRTEDMEIETLLIADEGPYAWLEIERLKPQFNKVNILYSIEKARNNVKILWIPRGDILKNIAALETAYRTNKFSNLNKSNYYAILVPNTITKKEIIQKDLDTLRWLKTKAERCYILNQEESLHNVRILKEKSGIHPITIREACYLEPTERDVSLLRKSIKYGKYLEDDYRSFILPRSFLTEEIGTFEYQRTSRFLNSIKQDFIVEGHKNFKEKKMEYWNKKEIQSTTVPGDWKRFFGKDIKLPKSEWEQKKLALLCYKAGLGFNLLYGQLSNRDYALNRLKHELSIIAEKGFYTYFLMVEDFIRYCRTENIRVGKGRGSVVGSVLAYCLRIIEIDPIAYELKFERFLNPFRLNKPDIDIDLPPSQIQKLFSYVKEKYGEEYVSKILTFNTFGFINAIQSLKNLFKIQERIETWFPKGLDNVDTFFATSEGQRVKKKLIQKEYLYIVDYARKLASLPQALSIHPAGVIISQELNQLPLISRDGELVLAFTKQNDQIERLGVTKFDFLSVKTLDIIMGTEQLRKELNKPLLQANFNDEKTYELYRSGNTVGVFQLGSLGMRKTARSIQPTKFEEVMDIISLYRPGPMDEIPRYVKNKEKGNWTFEGLNPNSDEYKDIVPILGKTHGIIVYQEQIMEIASVWAGYSLGEADLLRRAISEKKKDLMENEKKKFLEDSIQNGRDIKITEYIYELIEKFAEYGYNRSHAAGYTVFSFETAFQKSHYPVEFMTASLNVNIDQKKKLKVLLSETANMGIRILKPDLFKSSSVFTVTAEGEIRMGLGAINGIGVKQADRIKSLITNKQPKHMQELKEYLKEMNGRTMDILVRAGVFDSYGERYSIWSEGKDINNPLTSKQELLFKYIEWEQQLMQFTFSGLDEITKALSEEEYIVESISKIKDKKGRAMAFLKVVGLKGKKELVVYYNVWEKVKGQVSSGLVITPVIKNDNVVRQIKFKNEQ